MKESVCLNYLAWEDVEGSVVRVKECSYWWEGVCESEESPLAGQPCPWEGRPEEEGVGGGQWAVGSGQKSVAGGEG